MAFGLSTRVVGGLCTCVDRGDLGGMLGGGLLAANCLFDQIF